MDADTCAAAGAVFIRTVTVRVNSIPADAAATGDAVSPAAAAAAIIDASALPTGDGGGCCSASIRKPQPARNQRGCTFLSRFTLLIGIMMLCIACTCGPYYCLASEARHILFVSLSLRGHVTPLSRLASELVTRGHKVSFAVHEDGRDALNRTGARFLSLGRSPLSSSEREEKLKQISYDGFFRGLLSLLTDVYIPYSVPTFKSLHEIVRKLKLEHSGSGGPDLMVIDIGATFGAVDVAQLYHIPYVINNPSILLRLDNTPHYVPAWGSGFSQHMTLWERCVSVLYPRLLAVALTPTFMEINKQRLARGLPLYRTPHDIFGASISPASSSPSTSASVPALMLVNTAFGFEYPQPLSPFIRMTGPLMPTAHALPAPAPAAAAAAAAARTNSTSSTNSTASPSSSVSNTNTTTATPAAPAAPAAATAATAADAKTAASTPAGATASPTPTPAAAPVAVADTRDDIPSNLREWLENGKPVVLVLTGPGSMAHFERWQIKNLAQGLMEGHRFRVLWSMREEQRGYLGPILNSVPVSFKIKVALMAHNAVRVVVSPCGVATAQEALYYGKPLLCIPILGDQIDVAARVVDAGAGLSLDKTHLDITDISRALSALMMPAGTAAAAANSASASGSAPHVPAINPLALAASQRYGGFRAAAKRVGQILRAAGGVMTAADSVEYVLRAHSQSGGGLHHLIPYHSHLAWHEAAQLDVWAVVASVVCIGVLGVRSSLSVLVFVWYRVIRRPRVVAEAAAAKAIAKATAIAAATAAANAKTAAAITAAAAAGATANGTTAASSDAAASATVNSGSNSADSKTAPVTADSGATTPTAGAAATDSASATATSATAMARDATTDSTPPPAAATPSPTATPTANGTAATASDAATTAHANGIANGSPTATTATSAATPAPAPAANGVESKTDSPTATAKP